MFFFCDEEARELNNQRAIKDRNMRRIFTEVASGRDVSRASIARELGLTASTVSVLVEEMISQKLICEAAVGDSLPTGRRPTLLSVNPEGMRIPVLAFRERGIAYCMLDCTLKERENLFEPYPWDGASAELDEYRTVEAGEIAAMAQRLFARSRIHEEQPRIPALCIVLPGTFDWEEGSFSSTVIRMRGAVSFIDEIRGMLRNIPVLIAGETRMRGYAEFVIGGKVKQDTIFLEVGEGVGSGIFLNGRCYIGATGLAGEVGHISVNPDGPKCLCGNHGCLEKYISRRAIVKSVREATGRELEWSGICAAYRAGDAEVGRIIHRMARYLLIGISNMVCALNVRRVILGGDVIELGDGFLEDICGIICETGYRKGMSKVSIRFAHLPENSEIPGIARLYQDQYYRFAR